VSLSAYYYSKALDRTIVSWAIGGSIEAAPGTL